MNYLSIPTATARTSLACMSLFFLVFPLTLILEAANLVHLISSITACVYHHPSGREGLWLKRFICSVIITSRAKISAILTALVYLDRVKSRLDPCLFGKTLVRERIFIAALVLATKVGHFTR